MVGQPAGDPGFGGTKMNHIALYKEDKAGLTGISNLFIDTYMKDANDAQIKTYLYLVRAQSANLPVCISEIADTFNHTEKEVIRSLQYWERMNLLKLDYDKEQNITGIRLLELQPETPVAARTLAPIVSLVPAEQNESRGCAPLKPSYSADDIRLQKQNTEFCALLCIIEQYLGKPLSIADVKSILYIHKELEFSSDLIDTLLEYCLERGKKELRYIEKTAVAWYESNIRTAQQARKNTQNYDKTVYTVMKALGKSNTPTAKEVDYINKWRNTYGFSTEMILECCERTVLATDTHRFEYADGILSNWKKQNLTSVANVLEADRSFRQSKATAPKASADNSFNRFMRTSYDFDALEKEILSN